MWWHGCAWSGCFVSSPCCSPSPSFPSLVREAPHITPHTHTRVRRCPPRLLPDCRSANSPAFWAAAGCWLSFAPALIGPRCVPSRPALPADAAAINLQRGRRHTSATYLHWPASALLLQFCCLFGHIVPVSYVVLRHRNRHALFVLQLHLHPPPGAFDRIGCSLSPGDLSFQLHLLFSLSNVQAATTDGCSPGCRRR